MERTAALAQCVRLHHLSLSSTGGERDNALAHIRRLRQEHGLTNLDIGRALDMVEKTQGPAVDQIDYENIFGGLADSFRASGNPVYYNDIQPRMKALQDELRAITKEIEGLPLEAQVRPLVQLYTDMHYMAEGTGRNESGFIHGLGLKYRRDRAITMYMNAKWEEYKVEVTKTGVRVQTTRRDENHRPIYETDYTPELIDLMGWYYASNEVIRYTGLTKRQVLSIIGDKESALQKKSDDASRRKQEEG
jgi:hypothetical protein